MAMSLLLTGAGAAPSGLTGFDPFPGAGGIFPLIQVDVDFVSNWNSTSNTWTDVTPDIRAVDGVEWERGRNDEMGQFQPGRIGFTLNNLTRKYDPSNVAGPFYGKLDPGRPCRVTGYYPTVATPYVRFTGQIEDWLPSYNVNGDAICKASGIDFLGALANAQAQSLGLLSKTAVLRLGDYCAYADIPTARQNFTAGRYNLLAETIQKVSLLAACQAVADGQVQAFWTDRGGTLRTSDMFGGSGGGGVFGDLASELRYPSLETGVDSSYWYTQVQLTGAGSAGVNGSNPQASKDVGTSKARTGLRVFSRSVAAVTQADLVGAAGDYASSLARRQALRVKQVEIHGAVNPTVLWPVLMASELFSGYIFRLRPPGGGAMISQSAKVQSIRESVKNNNWVTTWMLSP